METIKGKPILCTPIGVHKDTHYKGCTFYAKHASEEEGSATYLHFMDCILDNCSIRIDKLEVSFKNCMWDSLNIPNNCTLQFYTKPLDSLDNWIDLITKTSGIIYLYHSDITKEELLRIADNRFIGNLYYCTQTSTLAPMFGRKTGRIQFRTRRQFYDVFIERSLPLLARQEFWKEYKYCEIPTLDSVNIRFYVDFTMKTYEEIQQEDSTHYPKIYI